MVKLDSHVGIDGGIAIEVSNAISTIIRAGGV